MVNWWTMRPGPARQAAKALAEQLPAKPYRQLHPQETILSGVTAWRKNGRHYPFYDKVEREIQYRLCDVNATPIDHAFLRDFERQGSDDFVCVGVSGIQYQLCAISVGLLSGCLQIATENERGMKCSISNRSATHRGEC